MDLNIDDVFNLLEDAENNVKVRNHFKERSKWDLNINALTIKFQATNDKLIAYLGVDFADPENQMKNEDVKILMELKGNLWKVIDVKDAKLS